MQAKDFSAIGEVQVYLQVNFITCFLKITDVALSDDPKEKGGEGAPGPSQESPEEFTDAKHESLFSLETNFLEDGTGGNSAQEGAQGQSSACGV